jgi:membrane protein YdbS with pleckstrin-like domain
MLSRLRQRRLGTFGRSVRLLAGDNSVDTKLENRGMNCPTCGTNVPDNAAFCPQCGARLRTGADNPTPHSERSPPDSKASSERAPGAKAAAAAGLRPSGGDEPEQELWAGGYSPKAMYGPWIAAALATIAGLMVVLLWRNETLGWSVFGIAVLLVWGGLLLTLAIRRLSVKYRLTNHRLFHEQGILRRVTDRIEIIDIDDVTVEQGIVERMLGVGTIHVSSSDRTSPELLMPGIEDDKQEADTIDNARRAERQRRGLFIESV